LAYDHVWEPLWLAVGGLKDSVKLQWAMKFAYLAGVRDTWQTKNPDWKMACLQAEVLKFMGGQVLDHDLAHYALEWDRQYKWLGQTLLDRQAKHVARAVKGGYRFTTTKGTRVIVFEGATLSSDAAELLGKEVDLVVGFAMFVENPARPPKLILSMRSHTSFDCSALARRYGGGGHTKAAGFSIDLSPLDTAVNPYQCVGNSVHLYENAEKQG
jgi:hypothetical protein